MENLYLIEISVRGAKVKAETLRRVIRTHLNFVLLGLDEDLTERLNEEYAGKVVVKIRRA